MTETRRETTISGDAYFETEVLKPETQIVFFS